MKKTILVLNSVQALLIRNLLRDYLRSLGDSDNFLAYSLDELIDYFDSLHSVDDSKIKEVWDVLKN